MMYRTNSLFPGLRTLMPEFEAGLLMKPSGLMAGFPDIDCYADTGSLVFKVELPGFSTEDVEIDVHETVLNLRGTKRPTERPEDAEVHFTEIRSGSFERKFTLPENVDTDQINAVFRNGVLTVKLPLVPETSPKKVRILTEQD